MAAAVAAAKCARYKKTVTKRPLQKNETSRDPLSDLCTYAHKCALVHTHTHPHILIHITHITPCPSCTPIRITLGSRIYGWEEEVVRLGANGGCGSATGGFLEVSN